MGWGTRMFSTVYGPRCSLAPLYAFLLASSAFVVEPALADGGLVVTSYAATTQAEAVANGLVSSSGQRAVLWKMSTGGWQLIIDPGTIDAEDAAWILPLPEVPVVSEASADFLDELDAVTLPLLVTETEVDAPSVSPGCTMGCAGAAGDGGVYGVDKPTDDVTIWGTGRLGLLAFDIVSATDSDSLHDWLVENGYLIPEDLQAAISPYVDDEFYFFVARFERRPDDPSHVPVVRFTLADTLTPRFPLRLSRWSVESHLRFTLWFILSPDEGFGYYEDAFTGVIPANCAVEQFGHSWAGDSPASMDFSEAYSNRLEEILSANDGRSIAVQYAQSLGDTADVTNRIEALEAVGIATPMDHNSESWSPEFARIVEDGQVVVRMVGEFPLTAMDEDLVFVIGEMEMDFGEYYRFFPLDSAASCSVDAGTGSRPVALKIARGHPSSVVLLVLVLLGRRWSRGK